MSYLETSNFLKLEMLEERRIKADLVMFFKFMNNFTAFCTNDIFRYNGTRRGHDKQLFVLYSRSEKCQFYWSNRLVSNSNRLPQIVVATSSTGHLCVWFLTPLWLNFNGHYEWLILLVGGVRIVLTNPASPL